MIAKRRSCGLPPSALLSRYACSSSRRTARLRAAGDAHLAVRLSTALLRHAEAALRELLRFAGPADQVLSRYFRSHRELGQRERAFIAEASFAVLRRRRSLEAAAAAAPGALLAGALARVPGFSGRALGELFDPELIERVRSAHADAMPE